MTCYIGFLYALSAVMFLNMSSLFILWISLEINMVMFISFSVLTMLIFNKDQSSNPSLFYMCIQILGTMGLIYMYSTYSIHEKMSIPFLILCSLKMGIFPFHSWSYKISSLLSKPSLVALLTIQKIPLMVVIMMITDSSGPALMIMNLIMGVMFLWKSKNILEMIVSSSIYSSIWLFSALYLSMFMMVTLLSAYVMHLVILMSSPLKSMTMKSINLQSISTLLFLVGLPPMSMFFFKISVFSSFSVSSNSVTFLAWAVSFLATMAYCNFFSKSKLVSLSLYKVSTKVMGFPILLVVFSSLLMSF